MQIILIMQYGKKKTIKKPPRKYCTHVACK